MTHFILDCDDVLLDWQGGFITFLTERDVHVDPAGPQSWCLADWIGCSTESAAAWVALFNRSASFRQMKAMPGAREFVWSLRGASHTCSVLTACGDSPAVRQARAACLWDWFAYPPSVGSEFESAFEQVDFLPLGASKFGRLGDYAKSSGTESLVFVEDNFKHAQSAAILGIKSYCLRRSHNRRDEGENLDTNVTWADNLACISNQLNVD